MFAGILVQAITDSLAYILVDTWCSIGTQVYDPGRSETHGPAPTIIAGESIGRLIIAGDYVFVLIIPGRDARATLADRTNSCWMVSHFAHSTSANLAASRDSRESFKERFSLILSSVALSFLQPIRS